VSEFVAEEYMKMLASYAKAVRGKSMAGRWTPEGIWWFDGSFTPHEDDHSASVSPCKP
jgi:hypothetical protein